jgi:hypothetical protein
MSWLLTLWPEYRENASAEVRIAEHTPAVWVHLTQYSLHILHRNKSVHTQKRKGQKAQEMRNKESGKQASKKKRKKVSRPAAGNKGGNKTRTKGLHIGIASSNNYSSIDQ